MIQKAKKEVFGHYLRFGLLDRLSIAYVIVLNVFANMTRSWRIIQKSQKYIFEWSKERKKTFLTFFQEFDQLDRIDIANCELLVG